MIYNFLYGTAVIVLILNTMLYPMEMPDGYATPQKKVRHSPSISYDSLDSDESSSSSTKKQRVAQQLAAVLQDRTNMPVSYVGSDASSSDEEKGENEHGDNSEQQENRIPLLERTFTRNYPALQEQVELAASSPVRQAAIVHEAQRLDPFLRAMYSAGYDTNPLDPTPAKTTRKHTRQRTRKLSAHAVRTLADDHLSKSDWSNIISHIRGYGPIHQDDELINPLREVNGEINLERMLRGEAPLGPDNAPINLHHVIQGVDAGHVAEISATAHRRETAVLHRGAAGIHNRYDFNLFRIEYWQARAYDFLESFGLNAY